MKLTIKRQPKIFVEFIKHQETHLLLDAEINCSSEPRETPQGGAGASGGQHPNYGYRPSPSHLPYQLPNQRYPAPGASPYGSRYPSPGGATSYPSPQDWPTFQTQMSVNQPLEGVAFTLSPMLKTDGELDYISAAIDSVLEKINDVNWEEFEYSFALERSVLVNDLLQNEDLPTEDE